MTEHHLRGLPLVLREEPFGGLLFRADGAVHIELDPEGFVFVREHLLGGRSPRTDDERALLARLETEIDGLADRQVKLFDCPATGTARPFRVYAAPTLADFQITERCPLGCPHCYASSEPDGLQVSLDDVDLVLGELSRNGVTQIALGGGEPLGHPDIVAILALCHHYHLVPNLTTNGLYLGDDVMRALGRYCGAVALSLEGVGDSFRRRRRLSFEFFEQCLARLLDAGLATVLQVTLSAESLAELDDIVQLCRQHPRLYGVIFLAYKEVGRGTHYHHVLARRDAAEVHHALRAAFATLGGHIRVGYDCCLTPALVGIEPEWCFTEDDQLEGCSAMRSSIGVLPNLGVTPCTFLPGAVAGNLREQSLRAIWTGAPAERFRSAMARHLAEGVGCRDCASRAACLGGCPAFDLVGCIPAELASSARPIEPARPEPPRRPRPCG